MNPISLEIKNFFSCSHGKIDFTKFKSAVIVGLINDNPERSNGAGKSTVLEAICWALFNKTRQPKIDDLIKNGEYEAQVEFVFEIKNNLYKITRQRSKVAKESSVNIYQYDNGWNSISKTTNLETDKDIIALIGFNFKVFINSVYFKQNDISLFADSEPAQRKEIIKTIMRLETWDQYQKEAKATLKKLKEEDQIVLALLQNYDNVEAELNNNLRLISETQQEIQKNENKRRQKEQKINEIKVLIEGAGKLATYTDRLTSLELELEKVKKERSLLEKKAESIFVQTNEKKIHCLNIKSKVDQGEKLLEQHESKYKDLLKTSFDTSSLEPQIIEKKGSIGSLTSQLEELNVSVSSKECPLCFSDISGKQDCIHQTREERKKAIQQKLTTSQEELGQLSKAYQEKKALEQQISIFFKKKNDALILVNDQKNKLRTAKLEGKDLQNRIESLKIKITDLSNQINDINSQEKQIKAQIQEYHHAIKAKEALVKLEHEQQEIVKKSNETNILYGSLLKQKEFLIKNKTAFNENKQKHEEIYGKMEIYESLSKYFGKDGIQSILMDGVIVEIEKSANNILYTICHDPISVKLNTQRRGEKGWEETLEIDVIFNGILRSFDSLSGGEKFRVSLALRLALSEVLSRRSGGDIKILLFDEIDSPLDKDGIKSMFDNIIKGLEKKFKILVITHSEYLKDKFSDIIVAKRSNFETELVQSKA